MRQIAVLRLVRLALGGAALGVAVAGVLGTHLGVGMEHKLATDALGALVGGAGAAVLLKVVHIAQMVALDGNWMDITSIVISVAAGMQRPIRRGLKTWKWHCSAREVIVDVLSGSSIMPFVLMVGSVFSSELLKAVLETNKLYMAIGGLIGLVVILAELLKTEPTVAAPENLPPA